MVPTSCEHSIAILLHNVLHAQDSLAHATFDAHALMRLHAHDTDTVTICTRMLTHLNDALDPSTDATDLLTSMTAMLPAQSDEGVDCVGVDNALSLKRDGIDVDDVSDPQAQDNPKGNPKTLRKRKTRNRERNLDGRQRSQRMVSGEKLIGLAEKTGSRITGPKDLRKNGITKMRNLMRANGGDADANLDAFKGGIIFWLHDEEIREECQNMINSNTVPATGEWRDADGSLTAGFAEDAFARIDRTRTPTTDHQTEVGTVDLAAAVQVGAARILIVRAADTPGTHQKTDVGTVDLPVVGYLVFLFRLRI